MRIISKGKDYYDYYAHNRQFSDQTYIWDRKPYIKSIDFAIPTLIHSEVRHYLGYHYPEDEKGFTAYGFVIWFCGRPVPVVQVHWSPDPKTEYFYNFDSLPNVVKGEKPIKWNKKYPSKYQKFQQLFELGIKGWEKTEFDIMSFCGNTPKKISIAEMHRQVGSPVFCHPWITEIVEYKDKKDAYRDESSVKPCVLINPNLYEFDFDLYMNAFEAFLSLERYLLNELAPKDSRMDIPISDKLKAESKGFDKFSFRRESKRKV